MESYIHFHLTIERRSSKRRPLNAPPGSSSSFFLLSSSSLAEITSCTCWATPETVSPLLICSLSGFHPACMFRSHLIISCLFQSCHLFSLPPPPLWKSPVKAAPCYTHRLHFWPHKQREKDCRKQMCLSYHLRLETLVLCPCSCRDLELQTLLVLSCSLLSELARRHPDECCLWFLSRTAVSLF